MDFVSSEKKESSEAIESDAILNGMHFCLEQKILLSWQRDVMALELYTHTQVRNFEETRTCMYFARPSIAIANIRDYS